MDDKPEKSKSEQADDGRKPYIVLARKYRPESFEDLIGQEAMVTTLRNAFTSDRIAQGYMLTGVRGVGKTTTARILARALNYSGEGTPDKPSVDFNGYGEHCQRIIKSGHPDVLEIDAASNTGVDNIREIIQNTSYNPLEARYKVFIIDEVHMLSKGAFNALLKTLEEPPPHVKFIFATTEIRKVPVTVLSRCQRFDLRRVDIPVLIAHFAQIAEKEGAQVQEDALRLIARAAEGSVRDGLSILDQAIAMGGGNVDITSVSAMLGLADRGRIFDLFETLLRGDTAGALQQFEALHRDGADPLQALTDFSETVHATTRAKIVGAETVGDSISMEEKRRADGIAEQLSMPILSRIWQMLLKGIEEVSRAPSPTTAAEMVLIRIAHTADLPTPDEIIKALGDGSRTDASRTLSSSSADTGGQTSSIATQTTAYASANPQSAPIAEQQPEALANPQSFQEVIALTSRQRDALLTMHLEENVSLISFEPGKIEFYPLENAPSGLAGELGAKLTKWTGTRWIAVVGRQPGDKPIGQVRRERREAEITEIKQNPTVATVLDIFPDAEITDIKPLD